MIPLAGEIIDGFVWGRGSTDCKSTLCLTLEAVEYLLKKGFVPDRDIYLEFGHDEEVGGEMGAGPLPGIAKKTASSLMRCSMRGPASIMARASTWGNPALYRQHL